MQIPDDLHPLEYARKMCDDLGLPAAPTMLRSMAFSIEALIKQGKSKSAAYEFLVAKALDARESGEQITHFWFDDAKWNAPDSREGRVRSEGVQVGWLDNMPKEELEALEKRAEFLRRKLANTPLRARNRTP